ncbi:MAG: hypothetical protein ACJ76H_13895 [Bacteriovoracaceae bacterium]
MKLKALVLSLTMTVSVNVFAQWFPGQVAVQVLPGQVIAQVFNPQYVPMVCSGQVFGQTYAGPVLTSGFIEHYLLPGTNRFAFVYTNAWAPFVNGWANFNCRVW